MPDPDLLSSLRALIEQWRERQHWLIGGRNDSETAVERGRTLKECADDLSALLVVIPEAPQEQDSARPGPDVPLQPATALTVEAEPAPKVEG